MQLKRMRALGSGINGYYANVRVTPSGELGGYELILIQDGNAIHGTLAIYEGVPSEPYAMRSPVLEGSNLTFQGLINGITQEFQATVDSAVLRLSSRTLGIGNQFLDRRADLETLARNTWEPGCGGPP